MNTAGAQPAAVGVAHDVLALSLAQALARELAGGRVELPGFPEVATQVQRVLADEDVTPLRVVRAVGAEPVLAGRIVQCANSVIFNPCGKPVLELRTAIARVGLEFVRTLTISFAVKQLKSAAALQAIEPQLQALWLRSVTVSTLCFVIARRLARVNADTALLAGLLHAVGALYIQTRAADHPGLSGDTDAYLAIESEWEANIAQALLTSWRVSEAIVDAIGALHRTEREPAGPAGLREVLRAAVLLERNLHAPQDLESALATSPACARLGLTTGIYEAITQESEAEIAALRSVLGC
ncbi:MAG: HDOD domain-containing protein [Steroidobacteraceae bacterium]